MFESDNPSVDDIVNAIESVSEEVDELEEQVDNTGNDLDPDDIFSQVEERAENTTIDTLDHLLNDDCDDEKCQQARDVLGIGDTETDESDNADDDTNESDGGESEDGESVDDGGTDTGGNSGGTDGSGDESDSGSDDLPWGENENVFGEEI